MLRPFSPAFRTFRSIRQIGISSPVSPAIRSRGVFCARCVAPHQRRLRHVLNGARRIAVLENVVDATNIGAIFRSAAALGMDAVLLTSTCCDPLTRRAVRVSMGTVFQIPWAVLDDWSLLASRRLFHLRDGAARRFNCAGRQQAFRSSEACHCPRRGGRRTRRLYYRRLRLHRPYPHGARRGFSQRRSGKRGCILGTSLPKDLNQAFRKRIRLDCAHNFAPAGAKLYEVSQVFSLTNAAPRIRTEPTALRMLNGSCRTVTERRIAITGSM